MEQLRLLLPLIAFNLWGNILAIAAMFALPLALLLNIDIRGGQDDDVPRSRLRALVLFTGTLLTLLVLVTALFFARVQGTSPYENIARISLRYYDFLFPLLFIIVAAAAHRAGKSRQQNYFKLAGIVAVTLIAAYAVGFRLNGYLPGIADSPELRAFTYNPHVFWGLGALGILCCVIALYRLRIGAMVFVWLFLPLTIVLSAHFTNKEMRQRLVSDAYDEAGQFAQRYLGPDVAKLAIVAPELVSIFRTHFYMRTAENTFISLPNGTTIDPAAIPANIEWLLMLGSYELPFVPKQSVHIPFKNGTDNAANSDASASASAVAAYTLVRIASKLEVNFLSGSLGPVLTKIEGLSEAESVGRWSTGKEVVLTFSKPLPNRFELVIDAFALGPNVDKAIKLGVNGKQYEMTLTGQPSTVTVQVASDHSDNKITLEIPEPISPKALGSSPALRTLGVALRHLIVHEPIQIREKS